MLSKLHSTYTYPSAYAGAASLEGVTLTKVFLRGARGKGSHSMPQAPPPCCANQEKASCNNLKQYHMKPVHLVRRDTYMHDCCTTSDDVERARVIYH